MLKKRIISLVCILCILLSVVTIIPASASEEDYEYFNYEIVDGEVEITGFDYYYYPDTFLEIPSEIEGYPVTKIGDGAFSNSESLEYITIPDTVTALGEGTFYNCSSLKSISIPASVEKIGGPMSLLCECESIERIIVDENNPYYDSRNDCNAILETATDTLIAGCMNTIIPEDTRVIEELSFFGCSYLESIVIPGSVKRIEMGAFDMCYNLTDVTIENGVEFIGDYAFNGCTQLDSVVIPPSVKELGMDVFSLSTAIADDEGLTYKLCNEQAWIIGYLGEIKDVTVPDEFSGFPVTEVYEGAFYGCSSLENITFSENIKTINSSAFMECTNLESVIIPDSVETIENCAFYGCTSLKSIYLGAGVSLIEELAFNNCPSVESIVVAEENGYYDSRDNANAIIESYGNLMVGCKNTIIPNDVYWIYDYAFEGCTELRSITIPMNVAVTPLAFYGCDNLDVIFYEGSEEDWHCTVDRPLEFPAENVIFDTTHYCNAEVVLSDTKEPGCSDYGTYVYKCAECENEFLQSGEDSYPLGHNVVDGVCTRCGKGEDACVESEHPYKSNTDETWVIHKPGAFSVSITFSEETMVDDWYDSIEIYAGDDEYPYWIEEWDDEWGTHSRECVFTGSELAGETITVNSDTVRIRLVTDDVFNYYGFAVDQIDVSYEGIVEDFYFKYEVKDGEATIIDNYGGYPEVTLPDEICGYPITGIGDHALLCYSGEKVIIPDSITYIGEGAFVNSLIREVYIPDSVKTLGDFAFCESDIISITIPEGMEVIGDGLFSGCKKLETVNLPSDITYISSYMFYNSSIKEITIPESVDYIGNYAFAYCENLESIVIPETISYIDFFTFAYSGLRSITIHKDVNVISEYAFKDCEYLTDVYYEGTEEEWNEIYIGEENDSLYYATIHFESTGPEPELNGNSITLSGDVGVNFYMDIPEDVLADENAKVVFTYDGETVEAPLSEGMLTDEGYKLTCDISAKNMSTEITCKVVSSVGESEEFVYSVKEYAEIILANPDIYGEETVALVKSMLNYGAAAQEYFGYDTENLANDTEYMTDEDRMLEKKDFTEAGFELTAGNGDVVYYGTALSLKSETAIKHYFILKEGVDADSLVVTIDGETATLRKNGNLYELVIPDIAAHNLYNVYEVQVGDVSISYSVMSYGALAEKKGDQTLIDVMYALASYADAAKEFNN